MYIRKIEFGVVILLLFGLCVGEYIGIGLNNGPAVVENHQNSLNIKLQTKDQYTIPFYLQLIESVAAIDDSLFGKAIEAIVNEEDDDDDYNYDLLSNDALLYQRVQNALDLDQYNKSFIDLRINTKLYTPRIHAHYDNYMVNVLPTYDDKGQLCQKDSFGGKLSRKPNQPFSWLLSKDRIYCTNDDLFALQLTKKSDLSDQLLPFDRIIGSNQKSPLLIFYGDLASKEFRDMFHNLYLSAEIGKLRFVWRYVPVIKVPEPLTGYGVSLPLKSGNYHKLTDNQDQDNLIDQIPENNISDVGIKLTSLILSMTKNSMEKFNTLKDILQNFPSYVNEIYNVANSDSEIIENVKANEKIGLSDSTSGIYINGAPINKLEMDTFNLVQKLESEVKLVQELTDLGFNIDQAKLLISKLALNYAVQLSEYSGGGDENRYRIYEDYFSPGVVMSKQKGGVAFMNDIETDENYDSFTTSRSEAYLSPNINHAQLPPLKENIHDLIFVLDLSSKEQLKVLFMFSKIILDKGIPQQIGVLPLGETDLDDKIAKYFYYLYETTSSKEALAFLYKVFMREDDKELDEIFNTITIGKYDFTDTVYKKTTEKYSITQPSVIFNGKIKDLRSDSWRGDMGRQITKDVFKLQQGIRNGHIGPSLKAYLFNDAKFERNLRIFPQDSSGFKYKRVTKDLINQSTLFKVKDDSIILKETVNIWLIGDLSLEQVFEQFTEIIKLIKNSHFDIRLRVIDSSNSGILKKLNYGELNEDDLETLLDSVLKMRQHLKKSNTNENVKSFISKQGLPPNHSFLLVNSRYLKIDESPFTADSLETVASFEFRTRVAKIDEIMKKYPEIFHENEFKSFHPRFSGLKYYDWNDLILSTLLKSFFIDDQLYVDDVSRFDFSSMNLANCLIIDNDVSQNPLIDILVIMDPISPVAQELITLIEVILNIPYVRTKILLQPKSNYETIPIKRYFQGVYPSFPIEFDDQGYFKANVVASFENIPSQEEFSIDILSPKRWVVKPIIGNIDLDNVKFENYDNKHQTVVYELSNLLVEGFARSISTALAPRDFNLKLSKSDIIKDTRVMSNLGYFQLPANHGTWEISCGENSNYELLSSSENSFEFNIEPKQSIPIDIFTMDGLVLKTRLMETKHIMKTHDKPDTKHADINIFTVASGELYEKLSLIMMRSIMNHTTSSVKFWLIDDYLTPEYKQVLPSLSSKYNFDYELISYKWPMWLRTQESRQRTMWGYKILFLDVLFPQDLDQVIFVDADQINRDDMKHLSDLDMGPTAPYGFVPMCESREEMEGYRFWKQGYWSKVLNNEFTYHISALFKVNLKLFRQLDTGDKLRAHYQKLSSDPNSLSNLDQDLPNNLQSSIPIFSLPQDYLWCETWCSDNSLTDAKNIDLCHNPLTQEPKLDVAKRLIPEWKDYQQEIDQVIREFTINQNINQNIDTDNIDDIDDEVDDIDDDNQVDIDDDDTLQHDEL